MAKLALCMIVKDEEMNLPKTLDSVKGLVDEIVVLDTGSKDQSVKIAKKYGAKIPAQFDWVDDFAAARNEALKSVKSDWVLVLDADEIINQEAIPAIKKIIENPNVLVVNLLRKEIGALQSPYSLVSRLFRRHPEINFSRPYHAIIDDTVNTLLQKESYWRILELPELAIFHFGYQAEIIVSQNKFERAQRAMEGYLAQHGVDPYLCSKLGALYLEQGREKEGISLLKEGLTSNTASDHVTYELRYHLANAYVREQKLEAAIKHYQKAIELPLQQRLKLGAYNNLAGVYLTLDMYRAAEEVYQTVLKIEPDFPMAYYNLGLVYKQADNIPLAIKYYQKAIELDPQYAAAYQNLGVVLLKGGNYQESFEAFQESVKLYRQQDPQKAQFLIKEIKSIGMQITE
jgi:tetratricopeptide (TPR) repeat protein